MINPTDQELAASYALDLLEPQRRAEFERLLQTEPEMSQLVRDFQDVSVALALDCPPQRISADTWSRIRLQVDWDREQTRAQAAWRRRTRWTIAGWAAAASLALAWWWSGGVPSSRSSSPLVELREEGPREVPARNAAVAEGRVATGPQRTSEQLAGNDSSAIESGTNLLHAQLEAARAREQRWSQALAAALNQLTNLSSQLDASAMSAPGLRQMRWIGLAPAGDPNLADQAVEALLRQLPGLLTNLLSAPAPWLEPGVVGHQQGNRTDESPTEQRSGPANLGELNSPVGVAFWDGRSPTMMVALSGVEPPPNGQQLVVWGASAGGQSPGANAVHFNPLKVLASPNSGGGHVLLVPAAPGSPGAVPRLFLTLEAVGAPLLAPSGAVVMRTP